MTYREADLVISNLSSPPDTAAGSVVPVTYTVTNQGTRDTRQAGWTDSLFLSNDATLDPGDYYLGGADRSGVLAIGQTYTRTLDVRIPQGIGGDYYLLAFADTAAHVALGGQGTIRSGLPGIYFEEPYRPGDWDNVDRLARLVARGKVPEFQDEGNNITGPAPDRCGRDAAGPAGHRTDRAGTGVAGPEYRGEFHGQQPGRRHDLRPGRLA